MDKLRTYLKVIQVRKCDTEELNLRKQQEIFPSQGREYLHYRCHRDKPRGEQRVHQSQRAFPQQSRNKSAALVAVRDGMRYIQEDLGDDQLLQGCLPRARAVNIVPTSAVFCRAMEMLPKLQFKGAEGLDYRPLSGAGFQRAHDPLRSELFQILLPESYRTGVQRARSFRTISRG